MKEYGGKVLFLDRDNINTDEIIPARYLTEIEKEPLKDHLLEDLKLEGFDNTIFRNEKFGVVVSRKNFGSGSSRENAVWAFEVNGINTIIAENFARIFRENAFNNGMLAIELPGEDIDKIFSEFSDKETFAEIDIDKKRILFRAGDHTAEFGFTLTRFQEDLARYGGWVNLAEAKYKFD